MHIDDSRNAGYFGKHACRRVVTVHHQITDHLMITTTPLLCPAKAQSPLIMLN